MRNYEIPPAPDVSGTDNPVVDNEGASISDAESGSTEPQQTSADAKKRKRTTSIS